MKKLLLFFIVLLGLSSAKAQFVYKIKADSVLITNGSCTAELIIENSTKNVKGVLVNKGNGRTEFRQAINLNDSMLVIGDDTLLMRGVSNTASNGVSIVGKNVQLGQTVGAPGNPGKLTSNVELPLNGYSLKFRTAGNDTLYIGQEGYGSSPSWHSTDLMTWLSDLNFQVIRGVGNTFESYPRLQLVNGTGEINSRYSGVLQGYNTRTQKADLLITVSSASGMSGGGAYGDVVIRPGTNMAFDNTLVTQYGNTNIKLQPSGTGRVMISKVPIGSNTDSIVVWAITDSSLRKVPQSSVRTFYSLSDFYTDANNSGTGETDLYSYTTSAGTLAKNGEKIVAHFSGTNSTATITQKAYFGGTQIFTTGSKGFDTGAWTMDIIIIRTGSSTARASVKLVYMDASTSAFMPIVAETDITGLTFTNTNILKITGQSTSSSLVTAKLGTINWQGAAN